MKILALEQETAGLSAADFEPHLRAEAAKVWQYQQDEVIREAYFRRDQATAVLMLECPSIEAAEEVVGQLPLAAAGLIRFELIPLRPYPGTERLFAAGVLE
jgi:hypothetical protein